MPTTYPPWIDGYAKAVYKLSASHDPSTHLPFDGFMLMPHYVPEWVSFLMGPIDAFTKSGKSIQDIIHALPGHSSLKFNVFLLAYMFSQAKTDPEIVVKITNFFVSAIKQRAVNETWWADNLIKKYQNPQQFTKHLQPATTDTAKTAAKISAGCGMLVHALYNDFATDLSFDVYGPYPINTSETFWVREYQNLNPTELWPNRAFPYTSIKIYATYKDLDSNAHYIGCHMDYKQNLIEKLSRINVEVDGKHISNDEELLKIKDTIFKSASREFQICKSWNFEKQKHMWMTQMCYQFKPFFEEFNLNWQPTNQLREAVKNKQLVQYWEDDMEFTYAWHQEALGANDLREAYKKIAAS